MINNFILAMVCVGLTVLSSLVHSADNKFSQPKKLVHGQDGANGQDGDNSITGNGGNGGNGGDAD
jgi:hypothetical protein